MYKNGTAIVVIKLSLLQSKLLNQSHRVRINSFVIFYEDHIQKWHCNGSSKIVTVTVKIIKSVSQCENKQFCHFFPSFSTKNTYKNGSRKVRNYRPRESVSTSHTLRNLTTTVMVVIKLLLLPSVLHCGQCCYNQFRTHRSNLSPANRIGIRVSHQSELSANVNTGTRIIYIVIHAVFRNVSSRFDNSRTMSSNDGRVRFWQNVMYLEMSSNGKVLDEAKEQRSNRPPRVR